MPTRSGRRVRLALTPAREAVAELGFGLVQLAVRVALGDPVEPDLAEAGVEPADHLRQVGLPFHAVDFSDRLYTWWVPGTSLPYLLPETRQADDALVLADRQHALAEAGVDEPLAGPGPQASVAWHRCRWPPPTACSPSSRPHRAVVPACARRTTPRRARSRGLRGLAADDAVARDRINFSVCNAYDGGERGLIEGGR